MLKTKKLYLPELDLLRGYAALFMVVNHLGNDLLSNANNLSFGMLAMLFITSFAPVLFFFTTGLGMGLQSASKQKALNLSVTVYKFTLLIVADLFLAFSRGHLIGLDFLGFIAIIVLLIDLMRSSRKAISICLISICAIFLLRFAIAPQVALDNTNPYNILTNWFIGNGVENISYPFSPWFIYPLCGFLLGTIVGRQNNPAEFIHQKRSWLTLLGLAIVFGGVAYLLFQRGFSFFRWGTIGIGFFIVSFSVISLSLIIVNSINKRLKVPILKLLYLSGPACLAVVPIHYFLIHVVHEIRASNQDYTYLPVLLLATVIVSLLLAKYVTQLFEKIKPLVSTRRAVLGIWSIVLVFAASTYIFGQTAPMLAAATTLIGQLLICLLFSIRIKPH